MEQQVEDWETYFSLPGDYRSFELVVEDKSLFVNSHFLAQISPFFAALCFNEFKEKEEGKATIGDEKFKDIQLLIDSIHPSLNFPVKPVDEDNLVMLARLADKYQVKSLLKSCEVFIDCEQFDYIWFEEPQLLDILRAVVEFKLGKNAMVKLLKRVAIIPLPTLIKHNAHNWLPSNAAVVLFLAAKANDASSIVKAKHKIISLTAAAARQNCCLCRTEKATFRCEYCWSLFCVYCEGGHAKSNCDSAPWMTSMQKCPVGEIDVTMLE